MGMTCESCGMPIETGRYCVHCVDDSGALQDFETRLRRMTSYRMGAFAEDREAAERAALAHMATMPAWRAHRAVKARTAG